MCATDVLGYVAEGPGLSVYALEDGTPTTYVSTARGLEFAMRSTRLLDRDAEGPRRGRSRPLGRRHDEY